MPKDRVGFSKTVRDELLPEIERKEYLDFNEATVTRSNLFTYAMALGIEDGNPTPVVSSQGLVLMKSVEHADLSEMKAVLVAHLIHSNELDKIADDDAVISLAERYANTGFNILAEKVHAYSPADAEDLIWSELAALTAKYEELFPGEGCEV